MKKILMITAVLALAACSSDPLSSAGASAVSQSEESVISSNMPVTAAGDAVLYYGKGDRFSGPNSGD